MTPFLDLQAGYRELKEEIDGAVLHALESGRWVLGEHVQAFEQAFASYVGTAACVGVGNGLDALTLILRGLGIGRGDEVIVPSNTFIATWLAVTQVGATIVPVEPDITTFNLDADGVAAALTSRTKGVVAVDLYGRPAPIREIARAVAGKGVAVIEDAAQAHGAYRGDAHAGADATATAWSFYPGKNLGAMGDGGAVTTDDQTLAGRVARLRNYGSSRKYEHLEPGVNSRLDEVQAAILSVKLRHLDAWQARRRRVAARYCNELKGTDVVLPSAADGDLPSWHLFVVRDRDRDGLARQLRKRGIETGIHYPTPPHIQGAYEGQFAKGSLPIAEAIHREVLSLPIGPHISDEQVDAVIAAIHEFRPR